MSYKRTLRSRIILSFALFGVVLTVLLGSTIFLLREYLEDQLLGKRLLEQLQTDMNAYRNNPGSVSPFTGIQGWISRPGRPQRVPREYHQLPTGTHDLVINGKPVLVAVQKDQDIWGFMQYDIEWNRPAEITSIGVLFALVISFWILSLMLAIFYSRRIMKPVTDLVAKINSMSDQKDTEKLKPYFTDDEIGQIAQAFDEYSDRLTSLVELDREFNADVSHELRTPLSIIRSATELLLAQKDLDDKTRTRLERIERAVKQSSDFTTALLHLVRQESDTRTSTETVYVSELVKEVIEMHKPHLEKKDVEVVLDIQSNFSIRASSAVATVVFGNIISNAFKYTPAGKVSICVSDHLLKVTDTGPGVPESELSQIFRRHYRGSTATGMGSGIGLAIVKRLCDLYDWKITVDSPPGQGLVTTISFRENNNGAD